MHFPLVIALISFRFTLVLSAPTPALDAATLLKNGQDAQKLNAQFQTIKITDPCASAGLTTACVGNGIANCVNNVWNTANACLTSQQCFAIPNVNSDGTTLTCTSEKSALSLIDASGATGGITGDDPSGSTSTSGTVSSSSSSTGTTTGIVTVTVTVAPSVTTLPITTVTISPPEASSLLFSIIAEGQTTSSLSSGSATSTNSATSTSETPSTIILLTAAPQTSASASPLVSVVSPVTTTSTDSVTSTATASVPTIIVLTAAPESSGSASPSVPAAAPSISTSPDSFGDGGY